MSEKHVIIADYRENRTPVFQELTQLGIEVQTEDLLAGDFIVGPGIGVERKAAADFVQSLFVGKLFGQISLCKAHYEKVVLLIEGDIYATRSQVEPAALDGAISYMSMLEGCTIVQTKDHKHTARMLSIMARHTQAGLGYDVPLRGGKPKDYRSLAQYLVEGLPGIGPGTAQKLLNHFGSAGAVFGATEQALCEVKGVGPKMAERVRDILSAKI
jgi:Fanconi anemia group M protein